MHCVTLRKHEPLIEDVKMGVKKAFYVFIASIIQSTIIFSCTAVIFGLQILLFQYNLLFSQHLLGMLFTIFIFAFQMAVIFYLFTLFIFLAPLIATENKGILSSLGKSVSLGWNHWWRVFSVQITPWLTYIIFLLLARYILNIDIHIYFIERGHHSMWSTLFNMIAFLFFIPWVASLLLTQLHDLELRKKITVTSKK